MDLVLNKVYKLKEDFEIAGGIVVIPAGTKFKYKGEKDPENDNIFKLTSLDDKHNMIVDQELFQSLFISRY